MAMAIDTRQQPQYSPMGYEPMRFPPSHPPPGPHFTNPWVSAPTSGPGHMYATSLPQTTAVTSEPQRYAVAPPPPPMSSAAYTGGISAPTAMPTGMPTVDHHEYLDQQRQQQQQQQQAGIPYGHQDSLAAARPYGVPYTSAPATSTAFAPTSAPQYTTMYGYERRPSHPLTSATEAERQSFNDALDASRGMVAMSQSDITPRNIYGTSSGRSSTDSYGFPATHSPHSSISSASTYPSYYNSSVSDASVGDYSSASESVDMPVSRTLPRPNGIPGAAGMPPAPQSMMGQFSSKVASSSQKKHKCKICDKRFTRPSSLQTHMYSHTGEKPFACDVEGCGRHFSVVSNLRRHRKVHKGEGADHPSPDDDE